MSDMQHNLSRDGADTHDIRAFLAKHFDVGVDDITDDAHLRNDLGADWLDRLELLILIEDNFDDIELSDDADRIEIVGDLIRHVHNVLTQRCATPAMAVS